MISDGVRNTHCFNDVHFGFVVVVVVVVYIFATEWEEPDRKRGLSINHGAVWVE